MEERTPAMMSHIFLLRPDGSPAPQMQPDPAGFVSRRGDSRCSLLHVQGGHPKHTPSLTPNASADSTRADLLVAITPPLPFGARAFPWSVKWDTGDSGAT